MLINIDGHYVDPTIIESILPVKAQTNNTESGGAFAFKTDTEVSLSNGKSFVTSMSVEAVNKIYQEAMTSLKDAVPSPPTPIQGVPESAIDADENPIEELVMVGDAILKEFKTLNESVHYGSEMLARLSMHITDRKEIIIGFDGVPIKIEDIH